MKKILFTLIGILIVITPMQGQNRELEELAALYANARNAKELTHANMMFGHALKVISGQPYSSSPLRKVTFDGVAIMNSLEVFMARLKLFKNFGDAELLHSTAAITEGSWLGQSCRLYVCLTPNTKEVYAIFAVFKKSLLSWRQAVTSMQTLDDFFKAQMGDGADIIFNRLMMDCEFERVNLDRLELAHIYMCQDGYIVTSVIPDAMQKGELHSVACFVNESLLNTKL
jgi:hypothetical protein